MTNAAGTLLAVVVVYLGGVAAGFWKVNPFAVLAAGSLLLSTALNVILRAMAQSRDRHERQ